MGRSSRKGWVHLLLKLLMKVKCCNPGNYCTAWTWHKKQHLIFPLYMYTLGRTESVWHLGSHGFPLCRFLRCMAWICLPSPSLPPAVGKYSGQAVANTQHSLLTVVRPWLLRGRRMSREKNLSVSQYRRQAEFRILYWHMSQSLPLEF